MYEQMRYVRFSVKHNNQQTNQLFNCNSNTWNDLIVYNKMSSVSFKNHFTNKLFTKNLYIIYE